MTVEVAEKVSYLSLITNILNCELTERKREGRESLHVLYLQQSKVYHIPIKYVKGYTLPSNAIRYRHNKNKQKNLGATMPIKSLLTTNDQSSNTGLHPCPVIHCNFTSY